LGFGEKIRFSIYGGFAKQGKLWNARFTRQFANDFDDALQYNGSSGLL